jgi:hypothetical protein
MPWSQRAVDASVAARRVMIADRLHSTKKRCSRCGQVKALEEFSSVPSRADSRHGWCRDCVSDHKRARRAADPVLAARDRARCAARRAHLAAEAEARAAAARIAAAITMASDIRTPRDDLAAALMLIPAGQYDAIAHARAAATRAAVDAQRDRAAVCAAWRRGLGPRPEPFDLSVW